MLYCHVSCGHVPCAHAVTCGGTRCSEIKAVPLFSWHCWPCPVALPLPSFPCALQLAPSVGHCRVHLPAAVHAIHGCSVHLLRRQAAPR